MTTYNLRKIMLKAWEIFRKNGNLPFAECLHRAWNSSKAEPVNAERIAAAKLDAGITEETDTYTGWIARGYKVQHGEKAIFGATLIHASRGDGAEYKARFFSRSQVQELRAGA